MMFFQLIIIINLVIFSQQTSEYPNWKANVMPFQVLGDRRPGNNQRVTSRYWFSETTTHHIIQNTLQDTMENITQDTSQNITQDTSQNMIHHITDEQNLEETYTEFDVSTLLDHNSNYTQDELDDLTSEAYASLTSKDDPDDEQHPADMTWDRLLHSLPISVDDITKKINHVQTHDLKLKSCYLIGVTTKNALPDIKSYYKLRTQFTKTLPYEIGFLVESIISHYQIAVELYHHIMMKYGRVRFRYFTPVGYMLYIYSNILQQSQVVIHLCNMLHEVEAKFANKVLPVVEKIASHEKLKSIDEYNKYLAKYDKRQKSEQGKQRKLIYKHGYRNVRPTRPRKGPLPLHYGWSIENW